jgi:hypothetical protein
VRPPHTGIRLEIISDAPAVPENNQPDARALGFAVYGIALD